MAYDSENYEGVLLSENTSSEKQPVTVEDDPLTAGLQLARNLINQGWCQNQEVKVITSPTPIFEELTKEFPVLWGLIKVKYQATQLVRIEENARTLYCALGAINHASGGDVVLAQRMRGRVQRAAGCRSLYAWNDDEYRAKSDVLGAFDRAIHG